MKIQQAVVHHKLCQTEFNLCIGQKNSYLAFQLFNILNRNDEKWPHIRQIKIAGQIHILPPLGIENTLVMKS
jgi:hypothetical protein